MVGLVIEQFRTELRWLRKLSRELDRRAPARHPQYAGGTGAVAERAPARFLPGDALSLLSMAFSRPQRRTYSEDELYEYAVGALARRMRTVAELKRLMRARIEDPESEYGETLVELVIRRLKDQGYLNDSQYAAYFSSLRRDNQKLGRMRVITELKTRGRARVGDREGGGSCIRRRERRKAGSRLSSQEAAAQAEGSEADSAHLPATGAGRIRDENHLQHPEEVGCG